MGTVTVIEDDAPDENATDSNAIAAAEANAHIAEVAEEGAEEAAQESAEAASVSGEAAEVAVIATEASAQAAAVAVDAAQESQEVKQDIHAILGDFKAELLASIAGLAHRTATEGEAGEHSPSLEIEIAPAVEPDSAPTEQHPYYKKWGKR